MKTPNVTDQPQRVARGSLRRMVGGIPTSHPERENFFRKARKCCVCGILKKPFAISKEFGAVCSVACLLKHNASNYKNGEQ